MISADLKAEILARFQCQNSGNCCRVEGWVYARDSEINAMAKHLGIDVATFRKQYVQHLDGWSTIAHPSFRPNCFLDCDNKCSVYPARPKACRTYPNWPEIWTSKATLLKEIEQCPGLKKAYLEVQELQKQR